MKKLMLLAATLVVAAIALSAPKATNAQTVAGYQIPYYLNIPASAISAQGNVTNFFCQLVKPQYGNGERPALGRFYYKDNDSKNTIFSAEPILSDVTTTSLFAYFHSPVAGDFLAYTTMDLNIDVLSSTATVNLNKFNRWGMPLWSTTFNVNAGPILINPTP